MSTTNDSTSHNRPHILPAPPSLFFTGALVGLCIVLPFWGGLAIWFIFGSSPMWAWTVTIVLSVLGFLTGLYLTGYWRKPDA